MNETDSIWRGRLFRYAPLIFWIGVIFFLSSSQGAMSNTSRIIRPLLEWFFPNASAEIITSYHAFIRKCAHFTEYAVLAFWAWRAFSASGREFLRKNRHLAAFALIVLIASIDEFNQSFNVLRTASPYDVLLDCCGGICMLLLISAVRRWKKN